MPFESVADVHIWVLAGSLLLLGGLLETVGFRRYGVKTTDVMPIGLSVILELLAVGSIVALIAMALWFLDNVIFEMPGW